MIEIDVSQAPRGVLAAQRLIQAVVERGDMAERHYLELKSTLDLSQKKDIVKIAKFVLGAANRMPDVAERAFEGYGVMVIGVADKEVTGVQPVEMMDLAKIVQKYVGAAGPRWDVLWVPVDGTTNQVLVVLVDPPQFGQGPFPCRANGDSLIDGRIYIRAEGETREANADELDQLVHRGRVGVAVAVDLDVEVVGEVCPAIVSESSTVDEYISRVRQRLIGALPKKEAEDPTANSPLSPDALKMLQLALRSSVVLANAMTDSEDRTEAEYIGSIDDWEQEFRSAWPDAIDKIVGSFFRPTIVRIVNRTTTFLHDVEVKLHLAGDVYGVDYRDPESLHSVADLELPQPPRKWGPTPRPLGLVPPYFNGANFVGSDLSHYLPSSISYRNGGSVILDLVVGELRPRGLYESEDEEFVLVVADHSLASIHGRWELTARDHDAVYTGEIQVQVGPPRDMTSEARRILRVES